VFHPLAYIVKLYIELVLTDLIIKVVRSSFIEEDINRGSTLSTTQREPGSATMVDCEDLNSGDIAFQSPQQEDASHITTSDLPSIWTSVQRSNEAARMASPNYEMQKTTSVKVDLKADSRESSAEVLPQMVPVFVRRYSGNWI
jgi:hypothetical protein